MTKDEIKELCEDDKKLQWWAMVLFAEIAASADQLKSDDNLLGMLARQKTEEFPRLIIQRQLEKIKEEAIRQAKAREPDGYGT